MHDDDLDAPPQTSRRGLMAGAAALAPLAMTGAAEAATPNRREIGRAHV